MGSLNGEGARENFENRISWHQLAVKINIHKLVVQLWEKSSGEKGGGGLQSEKTPLGPCLIMIGFRCGN